MDWRVEWKPITVDGEPFEWAPKEMTVIDPRGVAPDRQQVYLLLRRAGAEKTVTHEWSEARSPSDDEVTAAIRNNRERLVEPAWMVERRIAERHTNKLHMQWNRLSLGERIDLSRVWLARWEKTVGHPVEIADPSNLHAIAVQSLIAARARGTAQGEEEAAAQTRDVEAALARSGESPG